MEPSESPSSPFLELLQLKPWEKGEILRGSISTSVWDDLTHQRSASITLSVHNFFSHFLPTFFLPSYCYAQRDDSGNHVSLDNQEPTPIPASGCLAEAFHRSGSKKCRIDFLVFKNIHPHRRQNCSQTGDFVGFETKGAEEAKKWFDKSFIDSMRVTIEVVNVSSLRLKPNAYVFGVFRS